MQFQFVDNDTVNGSGRKVIRSHVMKGKNVGKGRPRRRKPEGKEASTSNDSSISNPIESAHNKRMVTYAVHWSSLPIQVGNELSLLPGPLSGMPAYRKLVHQFLSIAGDGINPPGFCRPVNLTQLSILTEYIVTDEAFLHSILAMAEVCVDVMFGRKETAPSTLRHLSNTYRCIRRNLEAHGAPPDSTVAAVMSLAIFEDLNGQPFRSKVHINALQRMVELRGGLTEFGATPARRMLIHKICRADIDYALHTGTQPRFYWDDFPQALINSMSLDVVSNEQLTSIADTLKLQDVVLRSVLIDIVKVCAIVNRNPLAVKLEPNAFQDIVVSLCYRLLNYRPELMEGCQDDRSDDAVHCTMLAFMTTLLFQHGRMNRLSYHLLAERLRSIVETSSSYVSMDQRCQLWLLFVGGISFTDHRAWFVPYIKTSLSALDISGFKETRKAIGQLLWIDVIHNKFGQQLLEAVIRG